MIPKPPIFLMAFANDKDYRLQLEEEGRRLREKLADLHDGRRLEYQSLSAATHDELYHSFNRFHNRIHVFHFSGHSGSTALELSDQKARAANLAALMGMQQNLKLVFLNGCDSQEQRKVMFEHGVKAIIGTRGSVPDQHAILFSEDFYDALRNGKTVKQSFDTASAKLEDRLKNTGVASRRVEEEGDKVRAAGRATENEGFAWILYSRDDADLDWTIPDPFEIPAGLDYHADVPIADPAVNKEFRELAFEGMARYNQEYKTAWEDYIGAASPAAKKYRLQEDIYRGFPSFLGVHIRDVFTREAEREGRLRLRVIFETYLALSKLLSSIAMASLWQAVIDEKTNRPKNGFRIRPEYRDDLRRFVSLSREEADAFDYIWLFSTIDRIFIDNVLIPFVDELMNLHQDLSQNTEAFSAYQFLEFELKRRFIARNIASIEVPELCEEAEKALGILLNRCAFLINYQVVSVNNISVKRSLRSAIVDFIHQKVILRGVEETTMDSEALPRKRYTCNHAVVVTKDFQDDSEPLTLTPFLIDENAFKLKTWEQPKIHFWAGYGPNGTLYYQHAEVLAEGFQLPPDSRNTYRAEDLQDLRSLWNQFIQDLNLEP